MLWFKHRAVSMQKSEVGSMIERRRIPPHATPRNHPRAAGRVPALTPRGNPRWPSAGFESLSLCHTLPSAQTKAPRHRPHPVPSGPP